jgi:hypothetical protein
LPVPVQATVRGPLGEFPASVIDVSPLGIELQSTRRLAENERVGLTLRCDAVRGPGVSLSGDVRVCREEPGPSFYVRVDFELSGESEKKLQTFLWGLEEARRKKRSR